MDENAPIYIIDDDPDDKEFIKEIFGELEIKNQPCFFSNGTDMMSHLKNLKSKPFLILCDVNIPKMDGFEIRKILLDDQALVYKSVPFIFWSTFATNVQIKKAYDLSVHGFFIKGKNYDQWKLSLKNIFAYWKDSKHPES